MATKSDSIKKTKAALAFLGFKAGKVEAKADKPKSKLSAICESMEATYAPKSTVSGPISPQDALYRKDLWTKPGDPPEGAVVRWSDGHLYKKEAVGWTLLPDSSNPNKGGPKAILTKDTPSASGPGEPKDTPAEHSADPSAQDKITQNSDKKNVAEPFPKGPAYVEGSMDGQKYHVMKQDEVGVYKPVSTHDTESEARRHVQTHTDQDGRQAHPDFLHSMVRWERNVKPGHEVHVKFDGGSARAQVTKVNDGSMKCRLMHDCATPLTAHAAGAEVTVPRATSALKSVDSKWNKGNGAFPITEHTPKADDVKWAAIHAGMQANGHASDYRVGDAVTVWHPSGHTHNDMIVSKTSKAYNRITLKHGVPGEGKDGYTLDMAGFAGRVTKQATAPAMRKDFKI